MGEPVIVCGKTEQIGQVIIAGLKPEYDVIHFVPTRESGVVQIPAILKGKQSPPSDSALGSKDYSKPPVAIILGGGPEYGKAMVARVKELLAQLEKEGKMNEDKVQWC